MCSVSPSAPRCSVTSRSTRPSFARFADARLVLLVRGVDNSLYCREQTGPAADWGPWQSLGGVLTSDITVTNGADGGVDVFVRGTDDALYAKRKAPSGSWTDWHRLGGGLTSNIAAGPNADGRIGVFVRGMDNAMWHIWQTTGGGWSDWLSLGGRLSTAPGVLLGADGRQFAVARDQRNGPSCIRQHAPNSSWGPWAPMS